MSRKGVEVILISCVLIVSFVVICENTEACFSIEVTIIDKDSSNHADRGEYTLYEIEVYLRPGCKSKYWLTFTSEGEPSGWSSAVLNESGGVIPYNEEIVLTGTVTVIFTVRVKAPPGANPGEDAWITTHIKADDKYNQISEEDVDTTTVANGQDRAPDSVLLSQTEITMNSVNLSWTQSDYINFDRYDVHMSPYSDFTPVRGTLIATINDIGTTNYNVTGLSAGSTYYFAVRVCDSGDSNSQALGGPYFADSNVLEAHTPGINYRPTAVVLSNPTGITNRAATLSWSQNMDEDFSYYKIYASLIQGFNPDSQSMVDYTISDQNIVEYVVTGLKENNTHYFKVRVVDSGQMYNDSNEVFCTTVDCIPLSTALHDPYDTTYSSTKLKWHPNHDTDFDHYEVHMSQTSGFTPSSDTLEGAYITNALENYTTISGLEEEQTYYFKVRIYDVAGHHSDSNEVWVTTPDGTPPKITMTTPSNNEVDIDPSDDIMVTFNEAMDTDPEKLTFTCSPDPGGWTINWNTSSEKVTFQHSTDLAEGIKITFEVTEAKDLAGNSLVDDVIPNPWSFTTKDITPPQVSITDPLNMATSVPIDTEITITFSEEMDRSSVEEAIETALSYDAPTWSGNTITLTLTDLLDFSTEYTVTIGTGAKDTAGNSLSSVYTLKFTTEVEGTNHAPDVTVSSPSGDNADDSFTIQWSATDIDEEDTLTISLYYDNDKDESNGMTLIESGLDNTGSYDWDTSEIKEGSYYIYVKADDSLLNAGSYSGRLTIDHQDGSSSDETGFDIDFFLLVLLIIIICAVLTGVIVAARTFSSKKSAAPGGQISCPKCGHQFQADTSMSPYVQCPSCGTSGMMK
ncbi:MAG: Ig-like domain-containing protein [Methanomassiliicoccales archaeon]|nr:MAG: Ig-like domain-containing protein [Methanomassiliicoccales archaeon]